MKRIILFAPIGGFGGSFLGTAIWLITESLSTRINQHVEISAMPIVVLLTVVVTIPACLIVGSPVVYAFRKQLAKSPLRWSVLVSFLAMWLGALVFGWAFTSTTSPEGLELLLTFSASSGFCYAFIYGWRTQVKLRATNS